LGDSCRDGIVLIDKNEGETSFDVVRKAKKFFKKKKVGHAGTLDPFATGLLIILLGQGSKLSPYLMSGRKRYLATMTLGVETDTLDKTGRIVRTAPVPELDEKKIKDVMQGFVGDIEQTPPAYSAVNLNGQRAYKLARQGIAVELKKRVVTIDSINIVSLDLPDIVFEVACSGGTYVRSLAADIGERFGSMAHLSSLRRLSSGSFEVKDALDSKMLATGENIDSTKARVISLSDALPDMKECSVNYETIKRILNGIRPSLHEIEGTDHSLDGYKGFIKVTHGPSLAAVMEIDRKSNDEEGWLQNIRVFKE
jgi:tRNA pseudouridine55 synthase